MEQNMFPSNEPDSSVKLLKRTLTLDFNDSSSKPTTPRKLANVLLQSPDVNKLTLASPEIMKMFKEGVANFMTDPAQIMSPRFVSDEQKSYSDSFTEPLVRLQSSESGRPRDGAMKFPLQQPPEAKAAISRPTANTTTSVNNSSLAHNYRVSSTADDRHQSSASDDDVSVPEMTSLQPLSATGTSSLANLGYFPNIGSAAFPGLRPTGLTSHLSRSALPPYSESKPTVFSDPQHQPAAPFSAHQPAAPTPFMDHHQPAVKADPKTEPSSGSSSPSLNQINPINMQSQETLRLERKRERNRAAAQKCRFRKLKRIADLDECVANLKKENSKLSATASSLREEVARMKEEINDHLQMGCKIALANKILW